MPPPLALSDAERDQLLAWTRSSKTSQSLALRSRIVLECAHAKGNHEVAQRLHVTPQTVGKWRVRFIEKRLDGLLDDPRPGAPRKLFDAAIAGFLLGALTGAEAAEDRRWSGRALAEQFGVSQSTVSRALRAMELPAPVMSAPSLVSLGAGPDLATDRAGVASGERRAPRR